MAEIKFKSDVPDKATEILTEALETESLRLEYSLRLAKERLSRFEKKYNVSSEKFINEWTAEDLEGKDLEYVEWAGEYHLSMRLNERLDVLKSIHHVST
ncbi:hypothetical protein [Desulfoglaeba alkanexedens]|uniref:Uncharacterized protein n=1 Tax=Desulfoglaeba alkanexedens ALDC TaxID=980445 RepID=A0A4V1ER90_9BACT|nr:hypothetical protein [Desulfoglaeba alkanexedens]QCQ20811.1 hypothetical protein FDQ92_00480 [Desulfoglaeba alkanexedens ALDC]